MNPHVDVKIDEVGDAEELGDVFVPGRVCLLGEHTDWASTLQQRFPEGAGKPGLCLVYGTSCGLYAAVKKLRRPSGEFGTLKYRCCVAHPPAEAHLRAVCEAGAHASFVATVDPHDSHLVAEITISFEGDQGRDATASAASSVLSAIATSGTFFSYVAGSLLVMLQSYPEAFLRAFSTHDAEIDNFRTDLPVAKGVSSSAAVCVLVVRAMSKILGIGELTIEQEMNFAYLGERKTPSLCGRMDQCVAFGRQPVVMTFENDTPRCTAVKLPPGAMLHFVVADMNRGKDTQKILSDLASCFDEDRQADLVAAAARSFLNETSYDLTMEAVAALEDGNGERLGRVFVNYQDAFDASLQPACPTQLSSPRLHELLQLAPLQPLIWGGKGVGSQGDGSVQFVCRSQAAAAEVAAILSHEGCHAFHFELSSS